MSDKETTYRETKVRDLPVALTPEQLEALSESLTDSLIQIQQLKEEAKDYAAEIKGKIAKHAAAIAKLTPIVHDRQEMKDVECEAVFDYVNNRVTVTRLDTEEVIEDRDLAETEKQMQMQLESGDEIGPTEEPEAEGTEEE
jgi:hypothetical protein